jgi:hypothetical protein
MMEHWRGAEKMQALVQRVKEAYAELQRQARALEAAASNGSQPIASAMGPGQTQAFNQDQSVETTIGDPAVPLTAESESNESHHQGPIAHPSMNSGQAPMGSDPVQLTPLQQAALTAIGHWLLVIGHCGSTKRTIGRSTQLITGDPKKMAQAGRLRSNAGSGGACLPIAA